MLSSIKTFWRQDFSPITKSILFLITIISLAKLILKPFGIFVDDFLVLNPALIVEHPWTLVTYIFADSSLLNVVFSAFWLWIIGASLEFAFGFRCYLQLLLMSVIFPSVLWSLTNNMTGYPQELYGLWIPLVGITWMWAKLYPENEFLLWGAVGIKAQYLAWIQMILVFATYADSGIFCALTSISAILVTFIPANSYCGKRKKNLKNANSQKNYHLKIVK